jgi:hypothetical protein
MQFKLTTTSRKLFFKEITFQRQGVLRFKFVSVFHSCRLDLTNYTGKE